MTPTPTAVIREDTTWALLADSQRALPPPRGSTSLSATLLKLHRTAAFSAVLAANQNAASDLLHPTVGE